MCTQIYEIFVWSSKMVLGVCSDLSSTAYCYRCGHCRSLVPDWKKAATALKVNTRKNSVNEKSLKVTYVGLWKIIGAYAFSSVLNLHFPPVS